MTGIVGVWSSWPVQTSDITKSSWLVQANTWSTYSNRVWYGWASFIRSGWFKRLRKLDVPACEDILLSTDTKAAARKVEFNLVNTSYIFLKEIIDVNGTESVKFMLVCYLFSGKSKQYSIIELSIISKPTTTIFDLPLYFPLVIKFVDFHCVCQKTDTKDTNNMSAKIMYFQDMH